MNAYARLFVYAVDLWESNYSNTALQYIRCMYVCIAMRSDDVYHLTYIKYLEKSDSDSTLFGYLYKSYLFSRR